MDLRSSSGVECPQYKGHCKKAGDMGINLHEPEAWPNLSPDPRAIRKYTLLLSWIWGQAAAKLDVKPTPVWPEREKL